MAVACISTWPTAALVKGLREHFARLKIDPEYARLSRENAERRREACRAYVEKLDAMVAAGKTAAGDPYDYINHRYVDERFNV